MVDKKISELDTGTAAGNDEIAIARGGVNFKVTPSSINSLTIASQTGVDATAFNNNLSASDTDAQTALDTIDQLSVLKPPTRVITAVSVAATQNPVGLDTPLQVEFGPAIIGSSVSMDAAGVATFHTLGPRTITVVLQFGRSSGGQASEMRVRTVINGAQAGLTTAVKVDSNTVFPLRALFTAVLPPTTTLSFEIYRDSIGVNAGGLVDSPNTLPWLPAPTARITIDDNF